MIKAIIEIPRHSKYKYEQDKLTGVLKLDRVLNQYIPFCYGYIPSTLCEDKDPLDVFVLSAEKIQPLSEINIEIIGGFKCKDQGVQDDKLVAVIYDEKEVFFTAFAQINNYLSTYKKGFVVECEMTYYEARKTLEQAKDLYHGQT